jgi:hypothetical protein
VERKPVERELDRIAREFLAPFLNGRFNVGGWKLISWDDEQALCLTFERQNVCLLIELEGRNDRLDCYARTARFNVCVRRQFEDTPLSDGDRRFVEAVIAGIRERESLLPDRRRPAPDRKTGVREILVDRLPMPEGKLHYYINSLRRMHDRLRFCYVIDRATSRRLEVCRRCPGGSTWT